MEKEEIIKKIKNKQINNVDDYLNKDCVDILISFVLYQKRMDALKYLNENNLLNAKQTNFMIEKNIFLFPFLNKKFVKDETFNKVLEKKAKYFQYFPEKLKKNKEWCIKAISYYGDNIKWIHQSCVNDIDIIVAALNKNSFYMNKLPDDYELLKRYQRENELNENLSKQDSILGKASQIKSNIRKKV